MNRLDNALEGLFWLVCATILAFFVCCTAHADSPTFSHISPLSAAATEAEAAGEALEFALSMDPTIEIGGRIYRCADGYHATAPISQGFPDHVHILRAPAPPGCHNTATYHTHPALNDHYDTIFSASDVELADEWDLTSYILPARDWILRRYTPHRTATFALFDWRVSLGDVAPYLSAEQRIYDAIARRR